MCRFHFDTARQLELDDEVDVDGADRDRLRTIAVCHDGLTEVVELFCDIFNLQVRNQEQFRPIKTNAWFNISSLFADY